MKTFINSLFVFPLMMFMAILFNEPASVAWFAIAVLWPVVLLLMYVEQKTGTDAVKAHEGDWTYPDGSVSEF